MKLLNATSTKPAGFCQFYKIIKMMIESIKVFVEWKFLSDRSLGLISRIRQTCWLAAGGRGWQWCQWHGDSPQWDIEHTSDLATCRDKDQGMISTCQSLNIDLWLCNTQRQNEEPPWPCLSSNTRWWKFDQETIHLIIWSMGKRTYLQHNLESIK